MQTHREITRRSKPVTERLDNVRIDKKTGCWLWQGSITSHGYGTVKQREYSDLPYQVGTHRLMYRLVKGPIPPGLVIRHKCDVRACCNPDHLEVGTCQDNIHDAMIRHGQYIGEKSGRAVLTEAEVIAIRQERALQGTLLRELAARYNVCVSTIQHLVCGTTWSHLPLYGEQAAA